jgi:sec-independent protein translocase protein TatA
LFFLVLLDIGYNNGCLKISGVGQLFSIGVPELLLILVLVLILFGPGKLPEIGRSLGKAMSEFKKAKKDLEDEFKDDKQ